MADTTSGWLLEGYPRTAFQAEELDFWLEELQQQFNWAIWLDVPEAVTITRCLGRARTDDRSEVIQRRIELFYDRTIPMMEYYDWRQRLLKINGDQPPDQVQQEILAKLS